MSTHILTSESVAAGHPDKIADQISDGILDAILDQDKQARVACETLVKTGMVLVAGEITTTAWVDIEAIARGIINDIGYNELEMGFDGDSCAVLTAIGKQSPDIAQGVNHKEDHEIGAGDQGMMFGFATNETEAYMPAPIIFSHHLMQQQAKARLNGKLPWLRPDAKCQVSVRYENGQPVGIETIVFSTQHRPDISQKELVSGVMDEVIKPVLPKNLLDKNTKYHINPTGRFVIGGPMGDCGLTGRKIIVDTYGGMAHHGGGCFSGKDPTKVDRSGAYMARYVAKNVVAAQLADCCEIQVSYAIGVANPTSLHVQTFGTEKIDRQKIEEIIKKHFDFRPKAIISQLDLLRPIYRKTAVYGHFGRDEPEFSWEKTDKVELLREAAGLKAIK